MDYLIRLCNISVVSAATIDLPQHRAEDMVPVPDLLPDVLPTERLTASGMPVPRLREELRRIPNVRNALNVASVWLQSVGLLTLACWVTVRLPLGAALVVWVATFLLMGRAFALFAILSHEAAHRLLFKRKQVNDLVGQWLLAYPAFVPFHAYRRGHFAHHKDEMGPNEPDLNLYLGYPITRASMRRKLTRDAIGISGWKNLKGLLLAFRSDQARPVAIRIVAVQVVLFAGLWLASGRWWLYPLFWLAPWMTVWRVINRLRSIAEHGGMTRSKDRRMTTHVVRQSWMARFWMVPFNTGWHLAHHVDMGVPFQRLPALHRVLVEEGWVTEELKYPSYRALWRALSSRPPAA
ncbi:fatty acid desaturase family protein [Rhabdothermincola sediminis]|uniref:fatty acid desaturase family protein n=1 Tax=Rhabdothermincola sediminis TaxID=2751370 RepID=UPI001AA04545|nr:fatty acid desaturase family protein [Rhabdothermincola sediminis]